MSTTTNTLKTTVSQTNLNVMATAASTMKKTSLVTAASPMKLATAATPMKRVPLATAASPMKKTDVQMTASQDAPTSAPQRMAMHDVEWKSTCAARPKINGSVESVIAVTSEELDGGTSSSARSTTSLNNVECTVTPRQPGRRRPRDERQKGASSSKSVTIVFHKHTISEMKSELNLERTKFGNREMELQREIDAIKLQLATERARRLAELEDVQREITQLRDRNLTVTTELRESQKKSRKLDDQLTQMSVRAMKAESETKTNEMRVVQLETQLHNTRTFMDKQMSALNEMNRAALKLHDEFACARMINKGDKTEIVPKSVDLEAELGNRTAAPALPSVKPLPEAIAVAQDPGRFMDQIEGESQRLLRMCTSRSDTWKRKAGLVFEPIVGRRWPRFEAVLMSDVVREKTNKFKDGAQTVRLIDILCDVSEYSKGTGKPKFKWVPDLVELTVDQMSTVVADIGRRLNGQSQTQKNKILEFVLSSFDALLQNIHVHGNQLATDVSFGTDLRVGALGELHEDATWLMRQVPAYRPQCCRKHVALLMDKKPPKTT